MLLDENELSNLNDTIKSVQDTDFLGLGVFPMSIAGMEKKKDKNGDAYLSIVIDTGFKKKDSDEARVFFQNYHLSGNFPSGGPKVELLAKFLKRSFGIKNLSNDALMGIKGRALAVATKKDADGYIAFWYAGDITDLKKLQNNYKPKEEETSYNQMAKQTQTAYPSGDNNGVMLDEDGLPF